MDDKDRVFARFKDDKPEASNRRALLTIPRRAGASGSRTVKVVHVRSGRAIKDRLWRIDAYVRAASVRAGDRSRHGSCSRAGTMQFHRPLAMRPPKHRSGETRRQCISRESLATPHSIQLRSP